MAPKSPNVVFFGFGFDVGNLSEHEFDYQDNNKTYIEFDMAIYQPPSILSLVFSISHADLNSAGIGKTVLA